MADHGLTGIFSLAVGAGDVGQLMAEDQRLPLISFTGSIPTGRRVAQTVAAAWAARCSNWAATTPSSSPTRPTWTWRCAPSSSVQWARPASAARVRGASSSTKSIVDALTERLVNAYRQVPIGDPLQPGTLMGPLATSRAVAAMQRAIERAVADGGDGPHRRRRAP